MNINLHKKIITNNRQNLNTKYSFIFYGRLMGWTDGEKVIDIDDYEDLAFAEALYLGLQAKRRKK